MLYRYSDWDGSQSIDPLSEDALLDLLSRDLLEDGDLRSALERLLMRGGRRPGGGRMQGMRDVMEQLRRRREDQLGRYDLSSFMEEIGWKLDDIVARERQGIEKLEQESPDDMREMVGQMAAKRRDSLDGLPGDTSGRLRDLMEYEFLDQEARAAFQELVDELRQKMLGEQFRNLMQGLERMTPEDLTLVREMVQALNQLLAMHARGGATEADFRDFMDRFGAFFPPGLDSIEDLVDYLEQQAELMSSLMQSLPEEMRDELRSMMESLLQDDRLQWDLMQMQGLVEQITGRPLGRRYNFSGDTPLGLEEAMEMLKGLNDVDELERELRAAMRDLDFDTVDQDLLRKVLGGEAAATLEEISRLARLLEEAGLANRRGNDMQLTAKGIRRIGERALKELFAELRRDRAGQHDVNARGASSEQLPDTKPWEFGDPFLVDIGASIGNAVRRGGPGLPVKLEARDLEIHRTEALTSSATVIAMDMSRSMFMNGAFPEAKRVTLALNTLIRTRYPHDYLELVVFSYYAMELKPERLLQSDWVDWGGTNIEAALLKARQLLSKRKSANRQIILVTDWRPRPTWGPGGNEGTVEDMLREVKRCTQSGIRINSFMMDTEPSSMALAQAMMKINKGRVFFGAPGQLGRYVLVDYVNNKRKRV